MGEGSLTRHFGAALVDRLAERFTVAGSAAVVDLDALRAAKPDLPALTLMARIDRIADALGDALPRGAAEAWAAMRAVLPEPLGPDGKVFNDGSWMLPLAAFWQRFHLGRPEIALPALAELTQRGTAEFAIRAFVEQDPGAFRSTMEQWVDHESFHVRRLATEGTRLNLPWKGRLRVSAADSRTFFERAIHLAHDASAYVRRSVGNHARDFRRIDSDAVDAWLATEAPPRDVARLASERMKGSTRPKVAR